MSSMQPDILGMHFIHPTLCLVANITLNRVPDLDDLLLFDNFPIIAGKFLKRNLVYFSSIFAS